MSHPPHPPADIRTAMVIGGAGFIGSTLVRRLLQSPTLQTLVVYDNFTSGKRDYLPEGDARLRVIDADVKHLGSLTDAMRGVDTVFLLAANPDIAKAVRQPDIDFWEGTYLAQNVLEAIRINSVPRLIYTSGSGVYGENPDVAFAEDNGPNLPISTYGASKLACEALICSYCHMFGIRARAFRFANVVGPRQTHGVGYDFVRRLRADPSQLRILGDGTQCKSYVHVDDVLSAIFTIMGRNDAAPYDVFNVATDDYITVNQIADIVVAEVGLDRASVDYRHTGGDRGWKGDVPVVRFDVSKMKALGWTCTRTSGEAVRDAVRAMIEELDQAI